MPTINLKKDRFRLLISWLKSTKARHGSFRVITTWPDFGLTRLSCAIPKNAAQYTVRKVATSFPKIFVVIYQPVRESLIILFFNAIDQNFTLKYTNHNGSIPAIAHCLLNFFDIFFQSAYRKLILVNGRIFFKTLSNQPAAEMAQYSIISKRHLYRLRVDYWALANQVF